MDNKCKLVNVVWIERGILLVIIACMLKKYKMLLNRNIIIDNDRYREFMKILFPTHKFQKYSQHHQNNFYFNIRKIIYMQDIIIDYANNYDDAIFTKKVNLVPWYDMNDILIYYSFDQTKVTNFKNLLVDLKFFSKCTRGNYYGHVWDAYIESSVFHLYTKFHKTKNSKYLLQLVNKFLLDEYTSVPATTNIIEMPQIYYVNQQSNHNVNQDNDVQIKQTIKKLEINNDNAINNLIELISNKLEIINSID